MRDAKNDLKSMIIFYILYSLVVGVISFFVKDGIAIFAMLIFQFFIAIITLITLFDYLEQHVSKTEELEEILMSLIEKQDETLITTKK